MKAVVFDLWNTLLRSDHGWSAFTFLKREYDIPAEEWRSQVKQLYLCNEYGSEREFLTAFLKLRHADMADLDRLEQKMIQNRQNDLEQSHPFPDAIPTLQMLRSQEYLTGIISNQASIYEQAYEQSRIRPFVDVEVFSHKVGFRKPDERIYKRFLHKSGLRAEDCVMIGDEYRNDFSVPLTLGINAILLPERKGHIRGLEKTIAGSL